MYELFVDESGSASLATGPHEGSSFVLVGIAVHEEDVHAVRTRVKNLSRTCCPGSSGVAPEFHSVDIWNNRGFFAKHAHPMSLSTKLGRFSSMADIISRPDISMIDVIVDKTRYVGRSREYILRMAWSALFDRFDRFLHGLPGGPQWGVVIADRNDAGTQSTIADAVDKRSKKRRAGCRRYVGVINDVHFRRSDDEEGIQMADGAAFMIRKNLHVDAIFRSECDRLQSRHVPRYNEQDHRAEPRHANA